MEKKSMWKKDVTANLLLMASWLSQTRQLPLRAARRIKRQWTRRQMHVGKEESSMFDSLAVHYPTLSLETTSEQWATVQVSVTRRC